MMCSLLSGDARLGISTEYVSVKFSSRRELAERGRVSRCLEISSRSRAKSKQVDFEKKIGILRSFAKALWEFIQHRGRFHIRTCFSQELAFFFR